MNWICPKCSNDNPEQLSRCNCGIEVTNEEKINYSKDKSLEPKSKESKSEFSWLDVLTDSAIVGTLLGLAQFFLLRDMNILGLIFAILCGLGCIIFVFLHPSLLHKFIAPLGILGVGELVFLILGVLFKS
jgi:hypothetical protein